MPVIVRALRTVSTFPGHAGPLAWLLIVSLLNGCTDDSPNDVARKFSAPERTDTVLFDRLSAAGAEAGIGLVTFHQSLSLQPRPNEKRQPGPILACRLGFIPSERSVGRLFLNEEEILQGPVPSSAESAQSWWALEPGSVFPVIEKKDQAFRLSGEKGASSRVVPIPGAGARSAPLPRLLSFKIRGFRSANRAPALQVFHQDELLFDEIIVHAKPREYRVPFIQRQEKTALRLAVRMAEVSIPVLADHSGTEAYIQIDTLEVRDPPELVVHMPDGQAAQAESAGTGACELFLTEFPSRSYAPSEAASLEDADAAQTRHYVEAMASKGEKLGRATRPGIPVRAPAGLIFPLRFDPPAKVTFSVGLTPAFRNHMFVQVRAHEPGETASRVLFEQLVAQPLLEPEEKWHAFTIDLPEGLRGDGKLEFRFSRHPESAEVRPPSSKKASPHAHAYFSNPRILKRELAGNRSRPNAIVVSIDTLRADHLSCYGYPLETSPNLDRFADNALIFTRAVSTSSWTLPAHLSLLSGMPLGVAGGLYKDRRLVTPLPTLAEKLQKAGYTTAAFVGGGYVSADFGMHRGFDLFDESSLDITGGYQRVAQWLETNSLETPFFLLFHFFDVHAPYGDKAEDPERFFRESGSPMDPNLVKQIREGTYSHEHACGSFKVHISDQARRHMIQLYNADIYHVDQWMEKLFSLLRETNLFDTTAIIITSDHGEEFGEHGNWHHSKHLYREVVQIPLLVKLPGRSHERGRVDAPVSLLDIAPTLATLAGEPSEEGWYGESLLDIAAEPEAFLDRKVLSENVIPHGNRAVRMIALQDGTMKYFRVFCDAGAAYADGIRGFGQGERQELYGLRTDPFEQVDVAGCYPRLLDSMKADTTRMIQELEKAYSGTGTVDSSGISQEVMEQLKALGYIK